METADYKELAEKIGRVENKLTDKLTDVLVRMGEIMGSVNALHSMKADVDAARDNARDALASGKQAHKRLDDMDRDIQPAIIMVNQIQPILAAHAERLVKAETSIRWAATAIIGSVLAGAIASLYFFARIGAS